MINTTSDGHGNFAEGNLCCDNKSCQKVLYRWFDEKDAPPEDRGGFFAYSVKSRLLFNRYPTQSAMAALSPTFVFSTTQQNKRYGYIVDFDVLPLKLDFCSLDCSFAWLSDDTKLGLGRDFRPLSEKKFYGVLVYRENLQAEKQLIADNPARFHTLEVGNFMPMELPKNHFELPASKEVSIARRKFEIRIGNVLDPEDGKAPIGISITRSASKCPMPIKQGESYQKCDQVNYMILDFIPSVWICPKCNGIVILDEPGSNQKHSRANLRGNYQHFPVSVNYYVGKPDWGNKKFVNWIKDEIKPLLIAVADAYDEQYAGSFGRSLMYWDDVMNLLGHLIH